MPVGTRITTPFDASTTAAEIEYRSRTALLDLADLKSVRAFVEDCNEALPHTPDMSNGVAAYALDPDHAEALWAQLVQS